MNDYPGQAGSPQPGLSLHISDGAHYTRIFHEELSTQDEKLNSFSGQWYDGAMNLPVIKTPCVGICSTGIGDDVCRGCKRYAHEVIDWNSYSHAQKAAIEERLVKLLTTIIDSKFHIVDEQRLQWQINNQPVMVPKHRNLSCQAYSLIKAGASSITDIADFGLAVYPEWQQTSLKQLCQIIDEDFYALSVAHFQRYYRQFA